MITRFLVTLTTCVALLLLAGCGVVYKQNIQQGNVLDRDDVAQLQEGMTKRQVEILLGSPSIRSPFHGNRWDYMNTFTVRGRKTTRRVLTLHFEDDRLVRMEGNYLDEQELTDEALREMREMEDEQAMEDPIPM